MESTTHWIQELNAGNRDAAQQLWERYYSRLVLFARTRLSDTARVASDEEDVAVSAFKSFCLAAEAGRFPELKDSDGLWRLLITIAAGKAINHRRHESRQKRSASLKHVDLDALVSSEPTPDFVLETIDTCRQLLARLDTDVLRQIALWKMEGFTSAEIAANLKCSLSTIERKLRLIRRNLAEADPPTPI